MTPEEKKARAYWMKRFLENAGQTHEAVDKATETLREAWAVTIQDMQNDINGWYSRFATEQGLTMTEAKRQMTARELAGLKLSLRQFEKLAEENANGQWEKELSAALARVRISRLEAMQLSLRNYLWEVYQNTHNAASEALRDAYTSEYYHNTYETQRAEGKFSPVEEIPTAKIDAILSKPWASDGWEWSSRIWSNREQLTNELQGELLRSIVQGKGPVEAAARLASKMGVGQYQAVRLIQTEATAVATMADRDSFQSLGVEKVEYVATLEAHTCPTCGGLDGKVFAISEVAASMTAPPMHPNCRCTLVPYFEDEKGRRWMKDPETFERKIVKNTTFEEWAKKYIIPDKSVASQLASAVKETIIKTKKDIIFKKISGEHTIEEDLASTNPNYSTGADEWTKNCQRCVSAFEARRRGFDVTAKPRILDGTDRLPYMFDRSHGWLSVYEKPDPILCLGSGAKIGENVSKFMATWGVGSRAIVRVRWKGRNAGGHVFMAVQTKDGTHFIDPQSNESDVEWYFTQVKRGQTYIIRVDNLKFTDHINLCCENVEGKK